MRLGVLVAGIVLIVVGVPFLFSGIGAILILIGVILLIVGAIAPEPGGLARPRADAYLRAITDRMWLIEVRQIQMEEHLQRIGEKLGVPPPASPSRHPAPLFPWMMPPPGPPAAGTPPGTPLPPPAPPPLAQVPSAPVPMPAPLAPPPPAPPARPAPAGVAGISSLEQQLGEKWFLWIGILVLAVAFAFFLAIVFPQLTPQQIVGVVFASAVGLALLAEYIFSRKRFQEYAKALEAGAFGIAYIGIWGGGFFFRMPEFPWAVVLASVLGLHAASALRYRSPVLATEVGLIFLAWTTGLRATGEIPALDAAILLSGGAILILGLVYALRDARSVVALTIAFDAVAIGAFAILSPYGLAAAVATTFVTAVVVTLLRADRLISLPAPFPLGAWGIGVSLAYGALIVNSFPFLRGDALDDGVILGSFVAGTAALAGGELLLRDRGNPLSFAALLAPFASAVPFLMARGELGLLVYPTVLLVLAIVRKAKGLAWFTNVAFVALIGWVAVGLPAPEVQFASAWALFFGLGALHAILQVRSGYVGVPEGWPADLPILFYAVGLVGLSARGLPGDWAVWVHVAAFPAAILLNRSALQGRRATMAVTIVGVGVAAALARWWALLFRITGFEAANGPLLAGFHAAVFLALAVWVARRKAVGSFAYAPTGTVVPFSWPALALLSGLLAQAGTEAYVLAALPPAVVVLAFYLDDPITFNVGFAAMATQTTFAALRFVPASGDATPILLAFAAALIGLGFALDLWTSRRLMALSTQIAGGAMWFPVAPAVFGAEVQTTVSWTIVGAVAVAWGLWRRLPYVRYVGFALFFAVLGKVFLYDIAGLDLAVRVLGLVILASSLLAISYGYARYRKRHALAG